MCHVIHAAGLVVTADGSGQHAAVRRRDHVVEPHGPIIGKRRDDPDAVGGIEQRDVVDAEQQQ